MDALLQPCVIENVFKFLGLRDIVRCQTVCKLWYDHALQRMRKCPPNDSCQALAICKLPTGDDEERRKKVIENRKMNRVQFNDEWDLLSDWMYYWYLQTVLDSRVLPKFEIDKAINSFMKSDANCIPGLSLIIFSKEFEHVLGRFSFNYPTVLIRQGGMPFHSNELVSEIDCKINEKDSSNKNISWKSEQASPMIYSFFQALNINRHIPGLKIIVTDWSDPQAPRPDVNDSEFPIRYVLLLSDNLEGTEEIKEIHNVLSKNSKPIFSGGIIKSGWKERDPSLFFTDSVFGWPKYSQKITISFAGKKIKSARHYIFAHPESEFKEKLEMFRSNLDFPINDGRVIGFLFDYGTWNMDWYNTSTIYNKISKFFPGIPLTKLVMYETISHRDDDTWNYPDSILHLIRY